MKACALAIALFKKNLSEFFLLNEQFFPLFFLPLPLSSRTVFLEFISIPIPGRREKRREKKEACFFI